MPATSTGWPHCSRTAGSAAWRTVRRRRSSAARPGVRQMYEMATRLYEDGTPKTKHLTSNVQIYVDDAAGTAHGSAYYCVTQATPELPLQVIITGHYQRHLPPHRRHVVVRHPDHVRRPGRRHQPPLEVLTAVSHPFDAGRLATAAQQQGGPPGLGTTAVRDAAGGAGRQLRRSRPERHRRAHPALRSRAQPADAAARPGVDPAASRDHSRRRSSRRSWWSA